MTTNGADHEVTILARVLANDEDKLPVDMARYLLGLGFSKRDKERMHELAVRNQKEELTPDEQSELTGYAKAGTVLSILKSKARRALNIKPKNRTSA